jgi:hypothetical protein
MPYKAADGIGGLAPSPGTPGEGWGEGDFENKRLSKFKWPSP